MRQNHSRPIWRHLNLDSFLVTLAPFLLVGAFLEVDSPVTEIWRMVTALAAVVLCLSGGLFLNKYINVGKLLSISSLAFFVISAVPYFFIRPQATLIGAVILISAIFKIIDFQHHPVTNQSGYEKPDLDRFWGALIALGLTVIFHFFLKPIENLTTGLSVMVPLLISSIYFFQWKNKGIIWSVLGYLSYIIAGVISGYFILTAKGQANTIVFILVLLAVVFLPRSRGIEVQQASFRNTFWDHPARILPVTFLALIIIGTLFLFIPGATTKGTIAAVDAAFTSVSSVCVTGLIVMDTPHDFTVFGQMIILLLIQLGGIGIMTITTVALHIMGKKISLRQERLLTRIAKDEEQKSLVASLAMILKFTLITELSGMIILTLLFMQKGDLFWIAAWRGLFTSISAFCNAGFSLQTDSLIGYQNNPLIIHTIGILIVLGGLAPATSLAIPNVFRKKRIPVNAYIALVTSAVLLVLGSVSILVLEWNGILAGLSIPGKLSNAWFQSITLRTAGFNSVNINPILGSTYLIMVIFMFIGGSPGGTAGGIKTSTFSVLMITFWANITNRKNIIIHNRRVRIKTVYRAVTIVMSVTAVCFITIILLSIMQPISMRQIIFETFSAVGTVGLSVGGTASLDEIGKLIIMIAMFAGRIGPMTLFVMLNEERPATDFQYSNANIILS